MLKKNLIQRLIPVGIILSIGDAWSTIYCIKNDIGYEYNPIALYIQNNIGLFNAACITAVYFSLLIALLVYCINKIKNQRIANIFLIETLLVLIVKAYVVFSNLYIVLN